MHRANKERTGVYQTKGVRNFNGIKWKLQIDPESESKLVTSSLQSNCPSIAGGVVYLCNKKYLYAINSQRGEELWRLQIDNTRLDNLILDEGIIYCSSKDGSLHAINIETQQIKWKSSINFTRSSSPVIYNNNLFVNSIDGNVYTLDADTGQERWRFNTTKDMAVTAPAFSDGVVYIGSKNGNVYALDAETGQEKWKCEVGQLELTSIPVIADDVVYIGIKNSVLYAIDAETGTQIWQERVEDTYYLSPLCPLVVDDEFIYIGIGIGSLCAINIETKQKSWQKLDRKIQRINSISIADDIIYCRRDGAINAIEAQSGNELWEFAAPEPNWWILKPNLWPSQIFNSFSKKLTGSSIIPFSAPLISNEVIYTFCGNGYLYALH